MRRLSTWALDSPRGPQTRDAEDHRWTEMMGWWIWGGQGCTLKIGKGFKPRKAGGLRSQEQPVKKKYMLALAESSPGWLEPVELILNFQPLEW